jgi:hypothetical protein
MSRMLPTTRGHADDDGVRRRPRHHRSCPDQRVLADDNAGQQRGVAADRGAAPDARRDHLPVAITL